MIAAAPLSRYDVPSSVCHRGENGECVQQSVYVLPENRGLLPGVFAATDRIMSLFERLVAPFPYEKLAHLQSSTRFGGMENASAIFYDGALFPTQKVTDGLLAHEMAHQWFGDAVTEREWAHLWLSEGFADYFTALWMRDAGGIRVSRPAREAACQVLADSVVPLRPVIDTAQTDYMALLNANSYDKGGFVLSMLHHELGDSAFFRGIRSYYAAHRHGNAMSDDLRVALERSSGRAPRAVLRSVAASAGLRRAVARLGVRREERDGLRLRAATGAVRGVRAAADRRRHRRDDATRRLVVDIPAEPRATVPLPGRFARRPVSIAFIRDSTLLARISRL